MKNEIPMGWLEVSLVVDSELAEAVAEVLARFAPDGVVIESTAIEADPKSEGIPTGPLRVSAYVAMDEEIENTRQQIEKSLWYLGRIMPIPLPEFHPLAETNWAEAWKKHYHPIPIGQRLMIYPAWVDPPTSTRAIIRINPGMAFGTGTHPSTQLCLQLMERYLPAGGNVIDVGCGSGILSIAAIKLGARHAFGVDIEEESIASANQNAAANHLSGKVDFAKGSLAEIRSGLFNIQQAPLVLANILTHILLRLFDHGLENLVEPGGILILSGILEEQLPELEAKIRGHQLQVIDQGKMDDWVALVLRR